MATSARSENAGMQGGHDVDAFTRFARDAAPRLLRSAQLLLGDRVSAEDATQTALLRVFRRWGSIDTSPAGYAASILVNACRDVLRQRARSREVPSDPATLELGGPGASARVPERLAVDRALAALPQLQREVVVLRFLLDLTVSDTARTLAIPEGTVKSATSRAFARLRLVLDPDQEEVHHAL